MNPIKTAVWFKFLVTFVLALSSFVLFYTAYTNFGSNSRSSFTRSTEPRDHSSIEEISARISRAKRAEHQTVQPMHTSECKSELSKCNGAYQVLLGEVRQMAVQPNESI